jgi:putative ABC transport system permease protein
LINDFRLAVRAMVRAPGFALVAVLALALGIGANTAIFTVVNAVLVEPLPYHDPDRLVVVWEANVRRPGRPNVVGPANFMRWRERATALEHLAAFYDFRVNLTDAGEPRELVAQAVSPEFFPTLGISPMLGRAFAGDEGNERWTSQDRVTVVSYELWQRVLGGDPSLVGRAIHLGGRPVTVIGVMPPASQVFLKAGSLVGKPADLLVPFQFLEEQRRPRGRYMTAIARLKPGRSLEAAQTEMNTIASGLVAEFPAFDTGWSVMLVPLHEEISGNIKPALLILVGAVAMILLTACANVANLLLARGASRRHEIGIRVALGASRFRIVGQLLTESVVLAVIGGGLGLLVGTWSLRFLPLVSPVDVAEVSGLGHLHLDYRVLAFTVVATVATAIICGFAPALEGTRADVQEALKVGRQIGFAAGHRRLRNGFVVAEIALAVALLIGAGLLLRSFGNLRSVEPGFDSRGVLTARVTLPSLKYADDQKTLRFFHDAVERIAAIPGVRDAGAVSVLPLAGLGAATSFEIVGQPPPPVGQSPTTDVRVCDNGFFRALSVPLVRGRLFSPREMAQKANVVIINEAMARLYFPAEDPLGRQLEIRMSDPVVPTTIIGVVGDVRYADLVTSVRPMAYWPHPQLVYSAMTLAVRTAGDPGALVPLVQREIQSLDKDQPLADVLTMDQFVSRAVAQARFTSSLVGLFAFVAVLLASLGIYGVMAYAVGQRTSEIGLRLALGASSRNILGMIVGSGLRLAALGVALGVTLAFALNRTLSSLLFQIKGSDPVTFVVVVVLLGAVALFASYLPARRAARIAPTEALRYQ